MAYNGHIAAVRLRNADDMRTHNQCLRVVAASGVGQGTHAAQMHSVAGQSGPMANKLRMRRGRCEYRYRTNRRAAMKSVTQPDSL